VLHSGDFLDNDKEHAVTGDITDDSGQLVIDLEPLALEDGDHTLTWLVGDSKGAWSEKVIKTFTVVTTGINNTRMPTNLRNDNWYDLSGRKLNGMPTRPGIYINNGRKIVVK
jgi:flagellar hook assembly protein FlgD